MTMWICLFAVISFAADPALASDMKPSTPSSHTKTTIDDDCSVDETLSSQSHVGLTQLRATALHKEGEVMPVPASKSVQDYCIRIQTGAQQHNDGFLEVSADTGSGLEVLVSGQNYAAKGAVVVESCYTSLNSIKVKNPTTNAWTGSIQYSSDGGSTYTFMYCSTCNGAKGRTEEIVVDGDADSEAQADTSCVNGNACTVVPKDYCIRIQTGTQNYNDGSLNVVIGSSHVVSGQKYATGAIVFESCYTSVTSLNSVKVMNPTTNAWTGSIQYSSNGGSTYALMYCASCTAQGSTEEIVVDGDANSEDQADTQCFNGDSCEIVAQCSTHAQTGWCPAGQVCDQGSCVLTTTTTTTTTTTQGCTWQFGAGGYIRGHQLQGKYGRTLVECQNLCDNTQDCKAINYSVNQKLCVLRSCTIGDKHCGFQALGDDSTTITYVSSCQPVSTPAPLPPGTNKLGFGCDHYHPPGLVTKENFPDLYTYNKPELCKIQCCVVVLKDENPKNKRYTYYAYAYYSADLDDSDFTGATMCQNECEEPDADHATEAPLTPAPTPLVDEASIYGDPHAVSYE